MKVTFFMLTDGALEDHDQITKSYIMPSYIGLASVVVKPKTRSPNKQHFFCGQPGLGNKGKFVKRNDL